MLAVLLSGNENESFNYNNDNVDYERLCGRFGDMLHPIPWQN